MSKISEKGLISIHLVVALISGAIWIVRLNDRVDRLEQEISEISKNTDDIKSYIMEHRYINEQRNK